MTTCWCRILVWSVKFYSFFCLSQFIVLCKRCIPLNKSSIYFHSAVLKNFKCLFGFVTLKRRCSFSFIVTQCILYVAALSIFQMTWFVSSSIYHCFFLPISSPGFDVFLDQFKIFPKDLLIFLQTEPVFFFVMFDTFGAALLFLITYGILASSFSILYWPMFLSWSSLLICSLNVFDLQPFSTNFLTSHLDNFFELRFLIKFF